MLIVIEKHYFSKLYLTNVVIVIYVKLFEIFKKIYVKIIVWHMYI
jgi:hypothetical protein